MSPQEKKRRIKKQPYNPILREQIEMVHLYIKKIEKKTSTKLFELFFPIYHALLVHETTCSNQLLLSIIVWRAVNSSLCLYTELYRTEISIPISSTIHNSYRYTLIRFGSRPSSILEKEKEYLDKSILSKKELTNFCSWINSS